MESILKIKKENILKFFFIASIHFLCNSCNQGTSQTEKLYIKNLEEKNRALENQLQEEKNKPPVIIEKPVEQVYVPQEVRAEQNIAKDYFTIGSTEDEVLEVMGDPTSIMDISDIDKKHFNYGTSMIIFSHGKVVSYSNYDNNLKVRVRKK